MDEHPIVIYSQYFVQLWVPAITLTTAKKKILWTELIDGSELLRRQFDGQITSIQQSNSNSFPSRAYIWAMGSWGLQYQTRIPSSAVDIKPNQVVVGYQVTNIGLI